MLKAVLFDMDGLIFDTESVYKLSWQYAAKEQGLELTDDFYQQFIGVQDPQCEQMLANHFGDSIDMNQYRHIRDKHFHELREQGIALKTGFDELFKAIEQRGLTKAIVTSSHLAEVKYNFKNSDYLKKFDLIITAEDVEHGKPSPDCYQMAYTKLGVLADECLVLEDSNNGVQAGLEAGCRVAMIPDLLPPKEEFLSKAVIVKRLDMVIPLLDQ